MNVPKFDSRDRDHQRLSAISIDAHIARAGAKDDQLLTPELENELAELVRRIAGGRKGKPELSRKNGIAAK